jgi:hypothetical protein
MLRVSTRTRDEARELARCTGQSMAAAVEQAVHEARVRAYYAEVARAVAETLADSGQRADYERETRVWTADPALADEVWTEDDFLGFDDEPTGRAQAA